MHRKFGKFLAAAAASCVLAPGLASQASEGADQLMARRRVFPSIGPGLRALRHGRDGKYYLLASPSVGIAVFDAQEKQLTVIGAPLTSPVSDKAAHSPISFCEDCDVDAPGNVYLADRGYNLVNVFSPAGALLRSMQFNSPTSLAPLPDGEVAVTAPPPPPPATPFGPSRPRSPAH